MTNQTRNRSLALAIAVGLLAGNGAALAAGESDSMQSSDSSMAAEQSSADTTAALSVEDQAVSQDSVVIDSVTMSGDGYLVIHAADDDGKLKAPESIGHKMLKQGEHENVKVSLDEPAESGDKLFAMLHEDTGEKGSFEFAESGGQKDGPMTADGKPVIKPFMVK